MQIIRYLKMQVREFNSAFVRWFVRSLVRLLVLSFVRSFVRSFTPIVKKGVSYKFCKIVEFITCLFVEVVFFILCIYYSFDKPLRYRVIYTSAFSFYLKTFVRSQVYCIRAFLLESDIRLDQCYSRQAKILLCI